MTIDDPDTAAALAALRDHLAAERAGLAGRLAADLAHDGVVPPGFLRLLADLQMALAAVDAVEAGR